MMSPNLVWFTVSLLPILLPSEISRSWYRGSVYFALKEGAFEPSSSARHATELASCLQQLDSVKSACPSLVHRWWT